MDPEHWWLEPWGSGFCSYAASSVGDPWHFGTNQYLCLKDRDADQGCPKISNQYLCLKDRDADQGCPKISNQYLCLKDRDADQGCPKIYGSCGSWTLVKSQKIKNRRNQGFSYYFCLVMGGSGVGSGVGSGAGSVAGSGAGFLHVTNRSGCGSGRLKNIRILRIWMWIEMLIRIQMRIRILNTGCKKNYGEKNLSVVAIVAYPCFLASRIRIH